MSVDDLDVKWQKNEIEDGFSLGCLVNQLSTYYLLPAGLHVNSPVLDSKAHPLRSPETMANVQYSSYDGVGKQMLERHRYSQAVRVPPNRIECAGQGTLIGLPRSHANQ